LVELFLRISKASLALLLVLAIGAFLRFHRLSELMTFIGDQGWFYLSARDLVLGREFPLVGITSSHIWLHQGALWTYMLSVAMWAYNFNPISGAYLTGFIGIASILMIYKVASNLVSRKFGLIAGFLYATSPIIVIAERMPYHTSPIPFFILLLIFSLIRLIKGRAIFFPISLFLMSILYNLELATIALWPAIFILLLYGFIKKEVWFKKILDIKIIAMSSIFLLIPMIPVLIYDFQNGFPQTVLFGGWLLYKVGQFIGIVETKEIAHSAASVMDFFLDRYSKLFSIPSREIAILSLAITFFLGFVYLFKSKFGSVFFVVYLLTLIPLLGFFASRTPSDAYLPMIFPGFILLIALVIYKLYYVISKLIAILLILIIGITNIYLLISSNYSFHEYDHTYKRRMMAAKKILVIANGEEYSLLFKGLGSEFESSTMNYEYITWWLGDNPPVKNKEDLIIVVEEQSDRIIIKPFLK